jgi:type IV pilus assembly protein PilO
LEETFGEMLRKLPNKTEVPNLLTDISQQGAGAGLDQKLFQPLPQNNKDFYAELPIKMRLTGSFHAIGAFVSGIAALPRIVTLHDVEILPASKDAKGGTDQLQLDVTAKTYRYLDEEELAAANPKPNQPPKR